MEATKKNNFQVNYFSLVFSKIQKRHLYSFQKICIVRIHRKFSFLHQKIFDIFFHYFLFVEVKVLLRFSLQRLKLGLLYYIKAETKMPIEPTKLIPIDSKVTYEVPERLTFIRKVGSGAYGTVASFNDVCAERFIENYSTPNYMYTTGGKTIYAPKVAIKKIQNAFEDLIDAKRILREIKLLTQFSHENIIKILDIFPPKSVDFEDIYIVTDLMETDLHMVISEKVDFQA